MAADIGPKIGIDGEKEFRDALKSMGQQLKTLGTEMKAVTSAFDVDNDSQKKLASQSDILSRQLEVQQQRITEIQKALDYARQNYAENSNEVQRWQQSLNNATADLNNTKKQLNDLEHGVDDVGDAMDNAGQKTLSLGDILKANLLSNAIMAGIKAVASGIKSLISGAIEGYGEYEQLVGGVETLFGGSADTVIKNAENAYKTAGLSANSYMETVTSFSASLLQSMGNDTEAAAKKADQALTDMSDNANKMGTDMSSIQNAYQGFAKQNYTMLDNLKLGYGGTKEEMQRLIDDGHYVVPATGRTRELIPQEFSVLHGVKWGIVENGCVVWDYDKNEMIWRKTMPKGMVRGILKDVEDSGVKGWIAEAYSNGVAYSDADARDYVASVADKDLLEKTFVDYFLSRHEFVKD